ncbi:MAG: gliding motility-associated C-terminal domain-containing protein [Saprospiraceae bacterium]|nr:gliding motility-associated C-terminal domain-containing protein [Saprospiraceae bacterium]
MRLNYLFYFVLLLPASLFAQTGTFDNSNEGWLATGDATSPDAVWQASGGNPGGYIRVTDASVGGTWYFEAPARYNSNLCEAYGKFLRWDQFTSDTANQQVSGGNPDVVIEGGGFTLVFDNAENPDLEWRHYDVLLTENAGWRLNSILGPVPTNAQFRATLASVNAIRIRGEYRAQADYGGLDNFVLESSFRFDLDADNSSGELTGGFTADTSCIPEAPLVDLDVDLFSGKILDSIVIRLPFAANNVFETLGAGLLPPSIQAQNIAPGWLRLANTGGATVADFIAALLTVRYRDLSLQPARKTRIAIVRVYSECGEMASRYAYLPIFPPGNAGLDADTVLCATGAAIDLLAVLDGTPDAGGVWRPVLASGNNLFEPSIQAAGAYQYVLPDAGPCPGDTATVHVEIEDVLAWQSDTTLCYGDTLQLRIPQGLLDWQWGSGSQQTRLEVVEPGSYRLTGETQYCAFDDSIAVQFYTCEECPLYAPNVFSPNDDGRNDHWQLFLPCAWQRFRLEVFDRWGNQVFVADQPELAWAGDWKGKAAAAGVYIWRLEWVGELFGEQKTYRLGGDVTLLR